MWETRSANRVNSLSFCGYGVAGGNCCLCTGRIKLDVSQFLYISQWNPIDWNDCSLLPLMSRSPFLHFEGKQGIIVIVLLWDRQQGRSLALYLILVNPNCPPSFNCKNCLSLCPSLLTSVLPSLSPLTHSLLCCYPIDMLIM